MNPIHTPSDGGSKVNVLGIPMVIRIHGRDTGGIVSAVESHDVTGGGPPPHIHHREDETFQILEGEYEWTVGGKNIHRAQGGDDFRAARDTAYLPLPRPKRPAGSCASLRRRASKGSSRKSELSPQQQQDIPRVIEIGKKYGLGVSAASRRVICALSSTLGSSDGLTQRRKIS